MTIFQPREVYKPFEYPFAEDYTIKQQQHHWVATEFNLSSDINDWKMNLSNEERNAVGNLLKGFTQAEVIISDYWSTKVTKWFPKPEIAAMALTFSSFEVIHQQAYSYLNDSLGLDNYDAFLKDAATQAKFNALITASSNTQEDKARSVAVFSAFAEGVQLFSSFAILMSFSLRDLLKNVGTIVSASVRDESLHSNAGCKLFREIIRENPRLWTEDFKQSIYEAARTCVKLEDDFIDMVFELGDIPGITKDALKTFIRWRANTKLGDLGLSMNWKNLNKDHLEEMAWFDNMVAGEHHQDFFANRVIDYAKGSVDFSTIFD